MTKLKIIILGIILPVFLALANVRFSSIDFFSWGHYHIKEFSITMFSIAIFCCGLLFVKSKHLGWRILSVLLALLLFLWIYVAISFRLSI